MISCHFVIFPSSNCETEGLHSSYIEFLKRFSTSLNLTTAFDDLPLDKITQIITKAIEAQFSNTSCNTDDSNILIKLLKMCTEKLNQLDHGPTDFTSKINTIADLHMLINYAQLMLNAHVPRIDPIDKTRLKKKYCLEEARDLTDLKLSYELQNQVYTSSTRTLHPHVPVLSNRIDEVNKKAVEYGNCVAVRPTDLSYTSVVNVNFE